MAERFLLALLISALPCSSLGALAQLTEITYAFMTSGGGATDSSGSLPAIELAEEMIRANSSILADYNLTHTAPRDTHCDRTTSLNQFFQSVPSSDPPVLALLGSGCSVATEPVAEIVHHWNISQISYSSPASILSNRTRFPSFFRTYPSDASFIPAIRSVIEFYGWKRVMFLTQDEDLFVETFNLVQQQLINLNITVENQLVLGHEDTTDVFNELRDFKVFFINSFADTARILICQAVKLGLTYPRYAWLTYGWYQDRWWTEEVNPNSMVDCTDQQLATFLERALALKVLFNPENTTAPSDTGLSADDFNRLYEERVRRSHFSYTFVAALAYDATWALAIALDRTAKIVDLPMNMVQNITDCYDDDDGIATTGLVPLEDFTYANSFMGCVIQWNLAQINFVGVSGQIKFDQTGSRVQPRIIVEQYRNITNTLERVKIGLLSSENDGPLQFNYIKNESTSTVYPDGIPPDGTPVNRTVTFHLALVVIYDSLAFLGLIFTTVCLVFNFAYRKRRIVRLTSPNLNYFIILGCYTLYLSIFFRVFPTTSSNIIVVPCHLQTWLSTVSYTLAFSTVLAKMIRVYHIFHNPHVKKSTLKDWHMIIIILSVTSVSVVLVLLGRAIPQLRPVPTPLLNERRSAVESESGVRINIFDLYCYNSTAFYWINIIYAYLALLHIIGFILAVQTRKVQIKALNESKHVSAIIYVTTVILIVLVIVTFTVTKYLNLAEVCISGLLLTGTTTFLAFSFIPKMVSLRKDPHGKKVFGESCSSDIAVTTMSSKGESSKIFQLESKIKNLEKELKTSHRRNTISTAHPMEEIARKWSTVDSPASEITKPRTSSTCSVRFDIPPPPPPPPPPPLNPGHCDPTLLHAPVASVNANPQDPCKETAGGECKPDKTVLKSNGTTCVPTGKYTLNGKTLEGPTLPLTIALSMPTMTHGSPLPSATNPMTSSPENECLNVETIVIDMN